MRGVGAREHGRQRQRTRGGLVAPREVRREVRHLLLQLRNGAAVQRVRHGGGRILLLLLDVVLQDLQEGGGGGREQAAACCLMDSGGLGVMKNGCRHVQ
jgi:hypothetical protein